MHSSVELTRELVRFNTVNPPGAEQPCAEHLARLLESAGFAVDFVPFGEGRAQLLARLGGTPDKLPLGFTGHLDTVPLGAQPWSFDPFAAEVTDGKLYGRGASDMKSGIAAFVTACIALADRLARTSGVMLVITAGEKTGCSGAEALVRANGQIGQVGALGVAEPTGNKSTLTWPVTTCSAPRQLTLALYGGPQHQFSSRPGDDRYRYPHHTGAKPHANPRAVNKLSRAGRYVTLRMLLDANSVWTDPHHPWISEAFQVARNVEGVGNNIESAPYFTDASVLTPAFGSPPIVIIGSGELARAHQTDEYCLVSRIERATEIYSQLVRNWCRYLVGGNRRSVISHRLTLEVRGRWGSRVRQGSR